MVYSQSLFLVNTSRWTSSRPSLDGTRPPSKVGIRICPCQRKTTQWEIFICFTMFYLYFVDSTCWPAWAWSPSALVLTYMYDKGTICCWCCDPLWGSDFRRSISGPLETVDEGEREAATTAILQQFWHDDLKSPRCQPLPFRHPKISWHLLSLNMSCDSVMNFV